MPMSVLLPETLPVSVVVVTPIGVFCTSIVSVPAPELTNNDDRPAEAVVVSTVVVAPALLTFDGRRRLVGEIDQLEGADPAVVDLGGAGRAIDDVDCGRRGGCAKMNVGEGTVSVTGERLEKVIGTLLCAESLYVIVPAPAPVAL